MLSDIAHDIQLDIEYNLFLKLDIRQGRTG